MQFDTAVSVICLRHLGQVSFKLADMRNELTMFFSPTHWQYRLGQKSRHQTSDLELSVTRQRLAKWLGVY